MWDRLLLKKKAPRHKKVGERKERKGRGKKAPWAKKEDDFRKATKKKKNKRPLFVASGRRKEEAFKAQKLCNQSRANGPPWSHASIVCMCVRGEREKQKRGEKRGKTSFVKLRNCVLPPPLLP